MEREHITAKVRAVFANMRHLSDRHDIRLSLKDKMHNATVVRLGLSALRRPKDFLYLTTDDPETLLEVDENIGWTVMKCVIPC